MQTTRYGFAPIEAMLTLAFLGVSAGLTLPAVQKAREVAARAKCAENLKRCGQAVRE